MQLVFPKWRAHAVRDWKDLLVDTFDGGTDLNAATAALLNYMPAIGITTLTEENAADAWCRIAVHQSLFGSWLEDPTTGRPLFLTRSDVLRHIGIETEGTQQSFVEFCGGIHQRAQRQDEAKLPSFIANGGSSLLNLLALSQSEGASSPRK